MAIHGKVALTLSLSKGEDAAPWFDRLTMREVLDCFAEVTRAHEAGFAMTLLWCEIEAHVHGTGAG